MQVAIPLFSRFTALDAVGPYEVLQRIPSVDVVFTGHQRGELRTENGMLGVTCDATFDEVGAPDVVVVPGGFGTRALLHDEAIRAWLRSVHPQTKFTTSVCTGALLLAGDAHDAGRRFRLGLQPEPGADLDLAFDRHNPRSDRPAARPALSRKLAVGASAQAVRRAEQRHRLHEIGLAGAIVADQHHRPRVEGERRSFIVAEVGELQLLDIEAGVVRNPAAEGIVHSGSRGGSLFVLTRGRPHTRIGIST